MARDSMTIRSKFQSWLHLIADLLSIGAARVKATARGRLNRAGHISLENDSFLLMVWIGHRYCGEKRAGIRVFGVAVDRLTRRDFYDLAEIHDRYPVADMLNHSEIVRDEEIGELHLLLKLLEQIDNLGLNGDIQGRDGLVRDDKPGTHGQGTGNTDPLPLAAAELMGITIVMILPQTHLLEKLHHPVSLLLPLGQFMDLQSLAHNVAHPHARVKRGVWILKDNLHLPAHVAHLARREPKEVLSLKDDFAFRRLDQPRSEEHTSELQSQSNLVCRLLLEKKKKKIYNQNINAQRSNSKTRTSTTRGHYPI